MNYLAGKRSGDLEGFNVCMAKPLTQILSKLCPRLVLCTGDLGYVWGHCTILIHMVDTGWK